MSSIRGRGNLSTEIAFLRLLRKSGLKGWRRHQRLPGRPDFIFPKLHIAIFIDGDFWHGNPLRYKTPKSNSEFWDAKIKKNRARDKIANTRLKQLGYTVLRIWESELKQNPDKLPPKAYRLLTSLVARKQLSVTKPARRP